MLTQLDIPDDLKLWSAAGIIHYPGPPIRHAAEQRILNSYAPPSWKALVFECISDFSYHGMPCVVAVRALPDFLLGATINVGIDVRLVRTSALLNVIG